MKEEKKCSEGKKGTVRGETEGREKEREFFSLWMLRASMQVLIKRIQKKRSQALLCGYVGEGHLGGLTSPPHLPVPCGASALFPRFATEPPSCTCVPQHQEKPSGQRDGRGLRGTQLIFFSPPLLTSMSGQTLQAAFEKGSDQHYLYAWALKPKTFIVSSRCKGFMGILLTAVVKILSFDCQSIEEKTEKTWGRASTSLRLRPCMFLSDLG